jgi:FixJ family two-component response regulator
MKAGAHDFLEKPIDEEMLLAAGRPIASMCRSVHAALAYNFEPTGK